MIFRSLVLVLLAITLSITGCSDPPPKVVLVYQIPKGGENTLVTTAAVVAVVQRRMQGQGKATALPDRQFEVTLYDDDRLHVIRMRKRIEAIGTIEFRILANRFDHPALIDRAEAVSDIELSDEEAVVARWLPLSNDATEGLMDNRDFAVRPVEDSGDDRWEILVAIDPYDVTGAYLKRVSEGTDANGRPSVNFQFNAAGARWFGQLTGDNLPDATTNRVRQLAIILNGVVHSAPTIQSRITDRGEITGQFTRQEVQDLVAVLEAGAMPGEIRFVEQR